GAEKESARNGNENKAKDEGDNQDRRGCVNKGSTAMSDMLDHSPLGSSQRWVIGRIDTQLGGELTPADLEKLTKSYVTAENAETAGIRRVDSFKASIGLDFLRGIEFPRYIYHESLLSVLVLSERQIPRPPRPGAFHRLPQARSHGGPHSPRA